MKRYDRIKKVMAETLSAFETFKRRNEVANYLKISKVTVANYSDILVKTGHLEFEIVKIKVGSAYFFTRTKKTFNESDAEYIIKTFYQKNKSEKQTQKQYLLEHELKAGIYLMSSNPNKHFEDKYKAQQAQIRSEYKSPKNYAGTSAGMVW